VAHKGTYFFEGALAFGAVGILLGMHVFQMNNLQGPAAKYKHQGHVIKNINQEFNKQLKFGQRVADWVVKVVGSWPLAVYYIPEYYYFGMAGTEYLFSIQGSN